MDFFSKFSSSNSGRAVNRQPGYRPGDSLSINWNKALTKASVKWSEFCATLESFGLTLPSTVRLQKIDTVSKPMNEQASKLASKQETNERTSKQRDNTSKEPNQHVSHKQNTFHPTRKEQSRTTKRTNQNKAKQNEQTKNDWSARRNQKAINEPVTWTSSIHCTCGLPNHPFSTGNDQIKCAAPRPLLRVPRKPT